MARVEINFRGMLWLGLSVPVAIILLAGLHSGAAGAEGHTFILPDSSGYGVSDCIGKSQWCSQVVASAWCEAHGYAAPIAYGKAQDITGTIRAPKPLVQPAKIDPNAFIVTCGD